MADSSMKSLSAKVEDNNVVASHHHGLGVHHGMLSASNPIVGVVAGQQDHHHNHNHHQHHHHVMHNHNHQIHELTLMSHQHLGGMIDNNNVGSVNDQGILGQNSFDTSSNSLGFVNHQNSIPNGGSQVTTNTKEVKTRKYNKTGGNKKRASAQINNNKDNSNEDEKRLKQEPVRLKIKNLLFEYSLS